MERDALGRQRRGLDHIYCAFPSRSAPCLTCAPLPWLQVALHKPGLREQPPTLPKAWSPRICTLSSLHPVFPSLCPAGGMAGACGSHMLLVQEGRCAWGHETADHIPDLVVFLPLLYPFLSPLGPSPPYQLYPRNVALGSLCWWFGDSFDDSLGRAAMC